MKLLPPIKHPCNFSPKLGFGILLILISWLASCTVETPAPVQIEEQKPTLISDFISAKWVGTNNIPTGFDFIDSGKKRTSCFSFTDVRGTDVTEYEWKSDIYISNNPPQQVWFYTTRNESNEMELSSLEASGDSFFYLILRYNVTDEHLDKYMVTDKEGKAYSVRTPLSSISSRVGKITNVNGTVTNISTSFKDYSIYMPVLFRNIRTDANGKKRLQINFAINFYALPVREKPNWQDIFNDLKRNISYGLIKTFWEDYYEVEDIEDGKHGCPEVGGTSPPIEDEKQDDQQDPSDNTNQQDPSDNTNQQDPSDNTNQQDPSDNTDQQDPSDNTNQQDPSDNTNQQKSSLFNNFISAKWVGTNQIPAFPFFIDGGQKRISCFSFTDIKGTDVIEYEWKSDIYISNNPPQQVWFYTTRNESNEMELSSLEASGDSFFYLILRYNVTDEHLDKYMLKDEKENYYSVRTPLNSISSRVGKITNVNGTVTNISTSFKDYSIYMPVLFRNIRTDANGKKRLQINFAINFYALPVGEKPNWQDIFNDLKGKVNYGLIGGLWTDYHEVEDIEDGKHGCQKG